MAKEIQVSPSIAGATLYALVRNGTGQPWRTDTLVFEAANSANYSHYTITLTEQMTGSAYYTADFPAGITARGGYNIDVRQQIGASPAVGDPAVTAYMLSWSGIAEQTAAAIALTGSGQTTAASVVAAVSTDVDATVATMAATVAANLNATITSRLAATADPTAALSSLSTAVGALTTSVAAVPAAVWAVTTTSLTTASSIGKYLAGLLINSDGSINLNMAQVIPTTGVVAGSVGRFFRSVKAKIAGTVPTPAGNTETFNDDAGNPALQLTYDNIAAPTQRTTVVER